MNCSNKKTFVTYLKVLACILITNSHCREIYPFYFLAIGGSFGNSLFLILSGYCLANIKIPFTEWIKKREERLLIPIILIILISLVFVEPTILKNTCIDTICNFYINKYWFVFAILLYYIPYYFIFKHKNPRKICISLAFYAIGYSLFYLVSIQKNLFWVEPEGFSLFKVYFYFGIFILGGYIRICVSQISFQSKKRFYSQLLFIIMAISVAIWIIFYALITILGIAYPMQFIIQFSVGIFSISLLLLSILYSDYIQKKMPNVIISTIADSTLEIYLVQVTFQKYCLNFNFPINWIVFLIIAFGGGILFHKAIVHINQKKQTIVGGITL